MAKKKLYVEATCGEVFMTRERHLEEMVELGIDERDVHPAGQIDKDFFWCKDDGGLYERHSGYLSESWLDKPCGKGCSAYDPRNGKSGICKHWRHVYEPDYTQTITIHINEIVNQ